MYQVSTISDFLLSQGEPEERDITNLKLQKLLYYAQGYHLAQFDSPLFPEEIKHWDHGPVVPPEYHRFKSLGSSVIPPPTTIGSLAEDKKDFLKEVFDVIGQFSAWRLRETTHQEPPWKLTAKGDTIPHDLLTSYFKTLVSHSHERHMY